MKTARIYCLVDGDDPFAIDGESDANVYAIGEWELKGIGSSVELLEQETAKHGRWLVLDLRPSRSGLDRQAKQQMLVGDTLSGFRNDPNLLPAANFATFVKAWRWEARDGEEAPKLSPPSIEGYEDLHSNVSDRIKMGLDRHIRPNINSDPDFFTRLNASLPPSSETSPSGSEPTTSTQESAPS